MNALMGLTVTTLGQAGTSAPRVAGIDTPGGVPVTGADGANPTGGAGGAARPQSPLGGNFMILMFGALAFMILMTWNTSRKDKKRRADLLGGLKKHDRVQTAGGMIGTVVELKDTEIVLKVDENTNTKVRFARSSVQTILRSARESTADLKEAEAEAEA